MQELTLYFCLPQQVSLCDSDANVCSVHIERGRSAQGILLVMQKNGERLKGQPYHLSPYLKVKQECLCQTGEITERDVFPLILENKINVSVFSAVSGMIRRRIYLCFKRLG